MIPFAIEKGITEITLFLDAPHPNEWIDKVDPNWSGAIPATLIVDNEEAFRSFLEKKLTYKDLEKIIKPIIKKKL